jgi:hypothetical protein
MRTLRKILRTHRAAAMWLLAAVAMLCVAGCATKDLTPSSARSLIEARVKVEKPLGVTFNYVPYLKTAGFGERTFTDYSQDQFNGSGSAAAMHRLLEAGLLEQRVEMTPYPNLTGSYEDTGTKTVTHYDWAHIRYVSTKKLIGLHPLTLSMQQGSTAISGNYTYTVGDNGDCEGVVSGGIDADGNITPVDHRSKWNAQSVSGGGLKLVGPATVYNAKSTGIITLKTYRYLLTKKFEGVAPDGTVTVGRFHVDAVTNLLLDSEISASGQFTWHIDHNEVGEAIYGTKSASGTGRAEFRKQPDGTWVCVSH